MILEWCFSQWQFGQIFWSNHFSLYAGYFRDKKALSLRKSRNEMLKTDVWHILDIGPRPDFFRISINYFGEANCVAPPSDVKCRIPWYHSSKTRWFDKAKMQSGSWFQSCGWQFFHTGIFSSHETLLGGSRRPVCFQAKQWVSVDRLC